MCGICGIVETDGRPVAADRIEAMKESLRHRGPDDHGTWLGDGVGLGHRRLAIIDLSPAGRQPLTNEDGTLILVANGEIYNYRELGRELRQRGHRFRSRSDNEVILHAYEEWGDRCAERFIGMWAFALYDTRRRRLFCSRDRFGIKPFYYHGDGRRFVFASEIKGILASGLVTAAPEPTALLDYLAFQYVPSERTLFRGIAKLEPGTNLVLDRRGLRRSRYWEIPVGATPLRLTPAAAAERLAGLFDDAVRLCLRSEVPLGTHLSGGLDTAAVLAFATPRVGPRIKTFTAYFPGGGVYDDTLFARQTARALGSRHFEIRVTERDFRRVFPRLIWHMDEPAAGEGLVPHYFVSRLARRQVTVVLGGQGSDEVLGGYTRHYLLWFDESLRRFVAGRPGADREYAAVAAGLPQLRNYQPLLRQYYAGPARENIARRYHRLIRRAERLEPLVGGRLAGALKNYDPYESFHAVFRRSRGAPLLDRILHYETAVSLPALLQVEDRMSMAVSLESRVPFLDHRLVEFAFRVPPEIKCHGGELKHLLRRVLRGRIPAAVADRPDKVGFPVPLARWAGADPVYYRARARFPRRLGAGPGGAGPNREFSRELWGRLCLAEWARQFLGA